MISNSYRISGDIYDYWDRYDDRCPCDSMIDCKLPGWKCSVSKIIEFAAQVSSVSAGPGRLMDLDMLVVGLGKMTTEEYRTHFTFWCILKSPLILGNKLYEMTVEDQEIVRNQKLIDINQDSRGAPAQRRWNNLQDNTQMWAGPLSNGFVVVLYNKSPESRAITASFADIFLDDEPVEAYKKQYKVVDLWSNDEKGKMLSEKIVSEVPSHGVKAYRIYYPGNAVNREL